MLNKKTWADRVLPAMAVRMGIGVWQETQYYEQKNAKTDHPIPFDDWEKIVEYYKTEAPDSLLPSSLPIEYEKDWSGFSLKSPASPKDNSVSMVTLVKIDNINHEVYTGDNNADLFTWSHKLKKTAVKHLSSAPVDLEFITNNNQEMQLLLTCIGTLNAVDIPKGQVLIDKINISKQIIIADKLPRPVQTKMADLNKDGLMDYVVCGFGHDRGSLYILQQTDKNEFINRSISVMPGAIQAELTDYNGDGWVDILVLFAHAKEGIWLFQNDGEGNFSNRPLIEFPPVYGSTSFDFIDINKDGKKDIIYTCGDNGDYSKILKPYHGIYIFINKGKEVYEKTYFFPVNGCTKAIAADFDMDGDLDIASIAFFSDVKNRPGENFLYFEQDGPMHFIPHSPPIEKQGRWICMDVGDYDGDGDLDIILGNYSQGFQLENYQQPDWNTWKPFIILENNKK
jgi:hypothetical protein